MKDWLPDVGDSRRGRRDGEDEEDEQPAGGVADLVGGPHRPEQPAACRDRAFLAVQAEGASLDGEQHCLARGRGDAPGGAENRPPYGDGDRTGRPRLHRAAGELAHSGGGGDVGSNPSGGKKGTSSGPRGAGCSRP